MGLSPSQKISSKALSLSLSLLFCCFRLPGARKQTPENNFLLCRKTAHSGRVRNRLWCKMGGREAKRAEFSHKQHLNCRSCSCDEAVAMKLHPLQYETDFLTLEFSDILLWQQNHVSLYFHLAQSNLLVKCLKGILKFHWKTLKNTST